MLERPCAEQHLEVLKAFQRDAVDYIFDQMYPTSLDVPPRRRFLLADEVGLGKTMVARGLIARVTEHLWDKVDRVNIVYICSNQNIASQNINRLNIFEESGVAVPARLTMLPWLVENMQDRKFSLVSLTPGTSFDLKSKEGKYQERAILLMILRELGIADHTKKWVNLLRVEKGHDVWRRHIKRRERALAKNPQRLNREMVDRVDAAIKRRCEAQKAKGEQTLLEEMHEIAALYSRKRKSQRPWHERKAQRRLVGKLRRLIADASVDALAPDLIILDEFQRFKKLLHGDGKDKSVAQLAERLFNYSGDDSRSRSARVLLLSATPYKMYTLHEEEQQADDHHYRDFFKTLGFLFEGDSEPTKVRGMLESFRDAITALDAGQDELKVKRIQSDIESTLKGVMLRTERFSEIKEPQGLIEEVHGKGKLSAEEVRDFGRIRELSDELEVHNSISYWKSSPYLVSLMGRNYKLCREIDCALENYAAGSRKKLLGQLSSLALPADKLNNYEPLQPRNSKVRQLIEESLDEPESWRLLWVPPTMPYYEPSPAFDRARDFTKTLVFSRWKMVPKTVATLYSYQAECRMLGERTEEWTYDGLSKTRGQLLDFTESDGRPQKMASLSLFYPCWSLARLVDPASVASKVGACSSYQDIFEATRSRIRSALEDVGTYVEESHHGQRQIQFWRYMVALDRNHEQNEQIQAWLGLSHENDKSWSAPLSGRGFRKHIGELREQFDDGLKSKVITPEELEGLTHAALASPAICALRALLRFAGELQEGDVIAGLSAASRVALGFRTRFNQPWITEMLQRQSALASYWEAVLDYCRGGNIQAMLDEYFHVLRESEGLFGSNFSKTATELGNVAQSVLSIRPASLEYRAYDSAGVRKESLRSHVALRFGDDKHVADENSLKRSDIVRDAFNSPFFPFVLATTSIGQEGLDFHQYCHRIYHWNLPSNPVDLEQREGRINRYKGHLIRRNLATRFAHDINEASDPWCALFQHATEHTRHATRGLQPNWIFEPEGETAPYRLERVVPSVPYSRDEHRLEDLTRTLLFYRMAFGQPRQQDLVEFLQEKYADLSPEEVHAKVRAYWMDLSPPGERTFVEDRGVTPHSISTEMPEPV